MGKNLSILAAAAIGAFSLTGCGDDKDKAAAAKAAVELLAAGNSGPVDGRVSLLSAASPSLSKEEVLRHIVEIFDKAADKKAVFDELLKPENVALLKHQYKHGELITCFYSLQAPVRDNLLKLNKEDFQKVLLELVNKSIIDPATATLYATLHYANPQSTVPNAAAEVTPAGQLKR